MYHDMAASKEAGEIAQLIKDYDVTREDYESARSAIEAEYAKLYDATAADFQSRVDEEAVASILGSKLGTQEFINELIRGKPSVARRIYNWVVDKLNSLNKESGYRNERLYWRDVKNKFDSAYRHGYEGKSNEAKYALNNIDNHSESTYNKYGWATVNDVLTPNEQSYFFDKIGEFDAGTQFKTYNGEYIFEIGDDLGINNTLVYTDGNADVPTISKIIRINLDNETELSTLREFIYECESEQNMVPFYVIEGAYGEGIIEQYQNADFGNYRQLREQRRKGETRYSINTGLQNGSGATGEIENNRVTTAGEQPAFSLRENDAAYMKAVESGDTQTAQRLVDEAAKAAGYTLKAYHGTRKSFTVFDPKLTSDIGMHFGTYEQAKKFTSGEAEPGAYYLRGKFNEDAMYQDVFSDGTLTIRDITYSLADENLLTLDQCHEIERATSRTDKKIFDKMNYVYLIGDGDRDLSFKGLERNEQAVRRLWKKIAKKVKENGYSGIKYENQFEGKGESYVVFDPEQIKSADAVTYDNDGNVIPLFERFNTDNNDVRYSQQSAKYQDYLDKNYAPEGTGKSVEELRGDKANGIFDSRIGTKDNYATQQQVDDYVDYALEYGRQRKQANNDFTKQKSNIRYADVDNKIINDIVQGYGVDIGKRDHALYDNDIRHIVNSHGTGTNEKYPITAADIKKIPEIVNNYDDILYVENSGKEGIYYVKKHNGLTYYLEQLVTDEDTLRNKLMVKVSTGTVPDIKGLREAVIKKWGSLTTLNDKIPQMYVRDVQSLHSPTDNNIPESSQNVKIKDEVMPLADYELLKERKGKDFSPKEEGFKQSVRNASDFAARKLTDTGYTIDRATRNTPERYVYNYFERSKSAMAVAAIGVGTRYGKGDNAVFEGSLTNAAGGIVDKSINEILYPFMKTKKDARAATDYLMHKDNATSDNYGQSYLDGFTVGESKEIVRELSQKMKKPL